jgi:hypothetical protein
MSTPPNARFATLIQRTNNMRRNAMPMKNPPYPGAFVRTELIEPVGLSVTAAALQVSRPALSSVQCDSISTAPGCPVR